MLIILNKIKKVIKRFRFTKLSIYGKKTVFDSTSNCINQRKERTAIRIGDNCCIRGVFKVVSEGSIIVGDNTYIGGNSVIGAVDKIKIGNNVIISTEVHIYDNNNHPTDPTLREEMCMCGDFFGKKWQWTESAHKPIIIHDNVWIGERATILKGVTIGKGAIIGCNTVVTHDVPEYSVVVGNPANIVKKLR